jgi:hypothetical protein
MSYFDPEIEALAHATEYDGPRGGECPECREVAESTGMAGPKATCPVCNFCFKYHHPKSGHGEA